MENSGDKFGPLLIPNCQRTTSQEQKFQYCPFARESNTSPADTPIPSSSSTDEAPEQLTGIEMVSLPDSFDEYQTPPEQPYSQNSSNDADGGHVAAPATIPADFDGEPAPEPRIVDLADVSDVLDTEMMDVDETEGGNLVIDTEVIGSPESAHQVFDEMFEREEGVINREKRVLPVLMRTRKENGRCLKNETFKDAVNRVLKMVGEGEIRGGGGDDNNSNNNNDNIDFMETAKMRGLTLPRPRWWPSED